MAVKRIDGLVSFSDFFGVNPEDLSELGAFDPLIDVDLPFAIDPKLLGSSLAPEMVGAEDAFLQRYRDVILLVMASKEPGDKPWREAELLVDFPEFKGACLGFGRETAAGRGWGPHIRRQVLASCKQIVDLGVVDPRFFELLGVFEDGIGPDLISDMIGTIIIDRLCAFTKRVCDQLGIPVEPFKIGATEYSLPAYLPPEGSKRRYIILLPLDILSEMPVALDRSDVPRVAEHNAATRQYLNLRFGDDWREYVKDRKSGARAALLNDPSVLSEFLERYEDRATRPYDFQKDPDNQRVWYDLAKQFLALAPTPSLSLSTSPTQEEVNAIVLDIVERFKHNVEQNGLYVAFYNDDGTPRPESVMQRTFQAVASAYCEANNLDLAPETSVGRGFVDFKVSRGSAARVCLELKRSANSRLKHGYQHQLPTYAKAEKAGLAIYVVIDCADNDAAVQRLREIHEDDLRAGGECPVLIVIEAWRHEAGSRA